MLRMEYGSKMDACWAAQNQHCGGDTTSSVPVSSKNSNSTHKLCTFASYFPCFEKKEHQTHLCKQRRFGIYNGAAVGWYYLS